MKKPTLTKKFESSPFDDYKDKVNYDYILKASLPIKFTSSEYDTPYEEQIEEALPELEEQIESLLTNEDYMKEDWEDVGLGRVYAKLENFDDDSIDIIFGVSSKEAENPFTTKDLIDYAKEFMWVLDGNTDSVSIIGVTIPGTSSDDNIDDSESLEPDLIHFKANVKSSKDVKVEVIKEPKTKNESYTNNKNLDDIAKQIFYFDDFYLELANQYDNKDDFVTDNTDSIKTIMTEYKLTAEQASTVLNKIFDLAKNTRKTETLCNKTEELDINMLDKLLVKNNELHFKDEATDSEIVYKLNDDGIIEIYVDNKLTSSLPFSKLAIQRECKKVLQEGFKLIEVDNVDAELEKTKQNIEQGIEKVDELQDLKNELVDKVNDLVNEDYEHISEFPSSEFTQKLICPECLSELDLQNNLTDDQKLWITNNICSIDEIISGLYDLFNIINITEPVISLDTYITESYKILNKEDTKNGK